MNTEKKRVFKTDRGTILIVNVEKRDGVTITADEIEPLRYDLAVKRNREIMEDNPELWQEAVGASNTELGFQEWVEDVIDADGEICMIDTSLYPDMIEIDGVDYVFEFVGCGCMHDEILKLWPEAKVFVEGHLVEMDAKANFIYHYQKKHGRKPAPAIVDLHLKEVERKHKQSLEAYEKLKSDDVDVLVAAYARQLVG